MVDISAARSAGATTAGGASHDSVAAPPHRSAARTGRRLRDLLVTTAGVAGITAVVAWLVALAAGLSLVVLTTGSMSPTIPAGGVAVTRDVSAAELAVGDVVTVPRAGAALPVTHRVVAVAAVPGDAEARSLTLQGDANATVDRAPVVVDHAGRVVASAPTGGVALAAVTSPVGRGVVTTIVGASVLAAFWPARRTSRTGIAGDASRTGSARAGGISGRTDSAE